LPTEALKRKPTVWCNKISGKKSNEWKRGGFRGPLLFVAWRRQPKKKRGGAHVTKGGGSNKGKRERTKQSRWAKNARGPHVEGEENTRAKERISLKNWNSWWVLLRGGRERKTL